jgi:hypothetical protein
MLYTGPQAPAGAAGNVTIAPKEVDVEDVTNLENDWRVLDLDVGDDEYRNLLLVEEKEEDRRVLDFEKDEEEEGMEEWEGERVLRMLEWEEEMLLSVLV